MVPWDYFSNTVSCINIFLWCHEEVKFGSEDSIIVYTHRSVANDIFLLNWKLSTHQFPDFFKVLPHSWCIYCPQQEFWERQLMDLWHQPRNLIFFVRVKDLSWWWGRIYTIFSSIKGPLLHHLRDCRVQMLPSLWNFGLKQLYRQLTSHESSFAI